MKLFSLSILVFCFSFQIVLYSQEKSMTEGEILVQQADSLLKDDVDESIKLAKTAIAKFGGEGSILVSSATILGEAFRAKGDYDSSLYYTNIGLDKALEINDTVNAIFFYINRGSDYYLKAEYKTALDELKKCNKLYGDFGYDKVTDEISPLDYAKLLNNIATAYIKTGRYDSSLVYFIKAIKIKEKNDAPVSTLIVSKINIGSLYLAIKDYHNSEIWIKKALDDATIEKDSGNIATCYSNLGILYKRTGDTTKAIESYKNSLTINESMRNHRNLSIVLQNLALLLTSQKKYDEAYGYFTQALVNNNKINANNSRLHLAISRMFVEQQKYDSAISHGNIAMRLAKESGNIDVQIEDYDLLFQAYKGKKRFPEALDYLEKYITLKDSISDQENQEYIQSLKTEFETERKEQEIEFLKKLNESEHQKAIAVQSRQRLVIIVTLLVLVLLIVLSISYVRRKRKEKELHKIEKKLLEVDLQNKELASKELQMENNFKTKQLTTHALNMMQKNQMLNDVQEKLKELSKQVKGDLNQDVKSMIRDISQSQKTEKEWELFKKYFEDVNTDFYEKLKAINPDLGTHDYRLAALISLNLNIKECAALLNISPNSVKTARYRLRTRLNVGSGEDLYVFLSRI